MQLDEEKEARTSLGKLICKIAPAERHENNCVGFVFVFCCFFYVGCSMPRDVQLHTWKIGTFLEVIITMQ